MLQGLRQGEGLWQLLHSLKSTFQTLYAQFELTGIPAKFLLDGYRHGIHQMGAAGFNHFREFFSFFQESLSQVLKGRNQVIAHSQHGSQSNRRRNYIVRTLPKIHMIVGMDLILSQYFIGPVGYDLVAVHVR